VDYPSMSNVLFISVMGFIGVIAAEFVFLYTVGYFYEPLDNYQLKRDIIDDFLYGFILPGEEFIKPRKLA